MKTGFVEGAVTAPPCEPRNGDTSRCAGSEHDRCPIILNYKNGRWVHAIRNRPYDHKPTPKDGTP